MNLKELDQCVEELAKQARLETWTSFVQPLKVPVELQPAFLCNRPELVKLALKRALSAEEAEGLYKLIQGLMETNEALRQHAQQVASLVGDWMGGMHGLQTTARKIQSFSLFKHSEVGWNEEEG